MVVVGKIIVVVVVVISIIIVIVIIIIIINSNNINNNDINNNDINSNCYVTLTNIVTLQATMHSCTRQKGRKDSDGRVQDVGLRIPECL